MKMACLNLGYSVMSNKISGSEGSFVKKCQLLYNNGWCDINQNFSKCTLNAVEFLSEYDIFSVQEVNNKYKNVFINKIRLFNPNFHFLSSIYHNDASIMIGYDYKKFGHGIKLTNNMKLCSSDDERAIQIIWFNKHSLLFINLHAPHNIDLKSSIELVCNSIELDVNPEKIIMMGDFNDELGELLYKSINIFGMELRLPNNSYIPKTCCEDVEYEYPGDYIFVSDYYNDKIYFGLPPNHGINLYSDHIPVILIYQ